MGTIKNFRTTADVTMNTKLKDGGVYIDWASLTEIRAWIYSDAQKALAGRADVTIDQEDSTKAVLVYAGTKAQYPGINRLIIQARYNGSLKTYDRPVFNFVARTAEATGNVTIDEPETDVEIVVQDVSSSILDATILAALSAADRANEAAEAAERMVDIHQGPPGEDGKSPYIGENGHWYEWDEDAGEYVDTETEAQGETGTTPDITIGTVTTAEPGTPAAATMTGTPEAPVLNLTIPKGVAGDTPAFTVGEVTTGQPGTPVVVTITGTAAAPVLNIQIPQGMQGNTGSSVDYPYELVNNLITNDATKGLSAAQGKVLKDELTQLEAEVMGNLMSARAKNALMAVFQKVAFTVPDVSDEIAELNNALFNLDELVGIEAEYTQGSTVIWSDGVSSLNDLVSGLVVNAVYGDGTRVPVASGYTLSGTLTVGTPTITVEYQGFTDTFTVTVTQYGSKMSYVLSDLSVIAYKFESGNATYGWTITDPATNRKHAFLSYGLTKLRNSNGTESNYYAIPIPKSATSVTVAITSNTLQVGGYFLKYDGVKLGYARPNQVTYVTGGYTESIDQTGDADQWYLVVPIKPASGTISSGQPTALSITFSNE